MLSEGRDLPKVTLLVQAELTRPESLTLAWCSLLLAVSRKGPAGHSADGGVAGGGGVVRLQLHI